MLFRNFIILCALFIISCSSENPSKETPDTFYYFDSENYKEFSCNIEAEPVVKILGVAYTKSESPLIEIKVDENFSGYRFTHSKGGDLKFEPTSLTIAVVPKPLPDKMTIKGKALTKEELEKAQDLYLKMSKIWQESIQKKYQRVTRFTETFVEDLFNSLRYENLIETNNVQNVPQNQLPLYISFGYTNASKTYDKSQKGRLLRKIEGIKKENGKKVREFVTEIGYEKLGKFIIPTSYSISTNSDPKNSKPTVINIKFTNCKIN